MLTLLVAFLGACDETKPKFPDAQIYYDAAPPPTVAAPVLAPIAGASAGAGRDLFAKTCAPCHGAAGRGDGPLAAALPHAPTDLTHDNELCRSTVGTTTNAVPSLADVEGALDRGTHAGRPEIASLDAAARRSLTLHVTSLAPGFHLPPQPVLIIPPETADTPEDRARGRVLYLAMGCWRCHGANRTPDADSVATTWNGRPLQPGPLGKTPTCGPGAARAYQTISLGLGSAPVAMPGYGEYAEVLARPPTGDPTTWTHALEGRISDAELTLVRDFYTALPDRPTMHTLPLGQRRERAAALLWSLVHYVGK